MRPRSFPLVTLFLVDLLFVGVVAAGLYLAGCTPGSPSEATPPPAAETTLLRVCFAQDKSGSADPNATDQLTVADLRPVLDRIARDGGEVMLALINAASNRPMVRLYVPPPPPVPTQPDAIKDPFVLEEKMVAYEAAVAEHERYTRDAEAAVAAFAADADALLDQPASARSTDLWGALARCEAALGEPASFGRRTYAAVVAVTDAIDTAGGHAVPIPLASGAEVLLVNGVPDLGALPGASRFEGVEAAVRYVAARADP